MNEIELEKQEQQSSINLNKEVDINNPSTDDDKSDGTQSEYDATNSFNSVQDDYKVDLNKDTSVTFVAGVNLNKDSDINNQYPLPPPVAGVNYSNYNNNNDDSDTDSTNSEVVIKEVKATLSIIEERRIAEKIKKEKRIKTQMSNDTKSLIILILGFICPFIWGFGFMYVCTYGKAKKYAMASVILFATILTVIVAGVPILAIGLTVGFAHKTCDESSCEYDPYEDDYYY